MNTKRCHAKARNIPDTNKTTALLLPLRTWKEQAPKLLCLPLHCPSPPHTHTKSNCTMITFSLEIAFYHHEHQEEHTSSSTRFSTTPNAGMSVFPWNALNVSLVWETASAVVHREFGNGRQRKKVGISAFSCTHVQTWEFHRVHPQLWSLYPSSLIDDWNLDIDVTIVNWAVHVHT